MVSPVEKSWPGKVQGRRRGARVSGPDAVVGGTVGGEGLSCLATGRKGSWERPNVNMWAGGGRPRRKY